MKTFIIAAILAASSAGFTSHAQVEDHPIPRLVQKDGRFALLVDGAPYLILGAQANNSSDSCSRMFHLAICSLVGFAGALATPSLAAAGCAALS